MDASPVTARFVVCPMNNDPFSDEISIMKIWPYQITMTILPLRLIQEEHLSVNGDRNVQLVLVTCLWKAWITDLIYITLAVVHKYLIQTFSC